MQAALEKMADPNYVKQLQEEQQQFGCNRIFLEVPPGGGNFTGYMTCADKVGNQVKLTGSVKARAD